MADTQEGAHPPLGSRWDGLSPSLLATFFAVKRLRLPDGQSRWVRDMAQLEVVAPLSDGAMETALHWQSPFESAGADPSFSSLSALLQAGGFASVLSALQAAFPTLKTHDAQRSAALALEGRTNITKLNSAQVFTGMAPIKISVKAHFRAYQDADLEVRKPIHQLMSWALPQQLAHDGPLDGASAGYEEALPSRVPQVLGMKYADMLIAPIVIESIPFPLTGPRTGDGILTQASLQLQLATLTALDKTDWQSATDKRGFARFNYAP